MVSAFSCAAAVFYPHGAVFPEVFTCLISQTLSKLSCSVLERNAASNLIKIEINMSL